MLVARGQASLDEYGLTRAEFEAAWFERFGDVSVEIGVPEVYAGPTD